MKKLGLLCVCTLLLTGCGIPKLENGQDAVVSFKNGDMISVDDLYGKLKNEFANRSKAADVGSYHFF